MGKLERFEVLHQQFFIRIRGRFGELLEQGLGFVLEGSGNRRVLFVLAVKQLGGHIQNIDIALENAALDDGELDRHHVVAELFARFIHDLVEVRVFTIHLVNDHHAGLFARLAHSHRLFGADDRAGNRADHDQRRIAKLHRRGDFAVEIKEARRVDQVDLGVLPLERRDRHVDGDIALQLFGIEVRRRSVVRETVYKARIVEHGLGQRGLAFAAVSKDTDVANFIRGVKFHLCSPCMVCFS